MEICFLNLVTSNQYVKSFIIITVFQNPTGGKVWRLVFPTVTHITGIAFPESTPSEVGLSVVSMHCKCLFSRGAEHISMALARRSPW